MNKCVVIYKANESDDKRPWGKWETVEVGHLPVGQEDLAFTDRKLTTDERASGDAGTGLAYCDKKITVNPGKILSIQAHDFRQEYWKVSSGEATVYLGETPETMKQIKLKAGDDVVIPQGSWHRMENTGTTPMVFTERQSGLYLDESDIHRVATDADPRGTNEVEMAKIHAKVAELGLEWPAQAKRSAAAVKATAMKAACGCLLALVSALQIGGMI